MPTYGRRDYVDEAVAMFVQQDYPAKELVILNDCPRQVFHSDRTDVGVFNPVRHVGREAHVSIVLASALIFFVFRTKSLAHALPST